MSTKQFKDRLPAWALTAANLTSRQFAQATVIDRPLPDFMVIGSKRGGTTSLFHYLIDHPGVLGLFPKVRGKKGTEFFFPAGRHTGSPHSVNWYRSHFHTETYRRMLARNLGYRPLSFEASPYYVWDPRTAERVRTIAPSMKAIVLVRDPVRRAWSHYQERVQNGVEPLSFEDALAAEDARLEGEVERMMEDSAYYSPAFDWFSYRRRGEYLEQIRRWHSVFPPEQLLVVRSEDLYRDTQATMDRIFDFLDLPSASMRERVIYNATWRTAAAAPHQASHELARHFEPFNADLEGYLGVTLGW